MSFSVKIYDPCIGSLVGFWSTRPSVANACQKVFVTRYYKLRQLSIII